MVYGEIEQRPPVEDGVQRAGKGICGQIERGGTAHGGELFVKRFLTKVVFLHTAGASPTPGLIAAHLHVTRAFAPRAHGFHLYDPHT